MEETWLYHYDLNTKQQPMEWQHSGSPRPKKFRVKNPLENFSPRFFGIKRHPPRWLSSKGPNYQCRILLISLGAIEGHFEWKTPLEIHQGSLVLTRQCPAYRALATQKKLAQLCFQCLDDPPYSPDLASSEYHLFPGLKNELKIAIFRPTRRSLLPRRPCLTENFLNFFELLAKVGATG